MRVVGVYEVPQHCTDRIKEDSRQPNHPTGTRQPPIFESVERTTELSHSWWRNRVDEEQTDAGQEELRGRRGVTHRGGVASLISDTLSLQGWLGRSYRGDTQAKAPQGNDSSGQGRTQEQKKYGWFLPTENQALIKGH